jgi:hypothetical protein
MKYDFLSGMLEESRPPPPPPKKKKKKEAEEIHLITKQWVTMIHVMKV